MEEQVAPCDNCGARINIQSRYMMYSKEIGAWLQYVFCDRRCRESWLRNRNAPSEGAGESSR